MQHHKDSSPYLCHDNQGGCSDIHDDLHHSNIDNNNLYDAHDHLCASNRHLNAKLLIFCMFMTFGFALVELFFGYISHSLALSSDALHMFTDFIGFLIAFIVNKISIRPASKLFTFGYGKFEAVGALVNALSMIILSFVLLFHVLHRLIYSVEVHGKPLTIVAIFGLVVNLIIVSTLFRASRESLNIKAALLHAFGDLFSSAVAIIVGVLVLTYNLNIADPILSLCVIIVLLISGYKIFKKSVLILISAVPEHIDYDAVGRDLLGMDNIISVHDLHIWYMSTKEVALCAHITTKNPIKWHVTLLECQSLLSSKHGINHVTLQHEFSNFLGGRNYCESI